MQISKSSWHYRFTDTFLGGFSERCRMGRHTTCSYIRAVFYALCACLLSVSFFGAVGIAALVILGSMLIVPALVFFAPLVHIAEGFLMFAVFGWLFVAAGLAIATLNYLIKHGSEAVRKRQSLALQAMQDKKDGVCTIVHITE